MTSFAGSLGPDHAAHGLWPLALMKSLQRHGSSAGAARAGIALPPSALMRVRQAMASLAGRLAPDHEVHVAADLLQVVKPPAL